ncbi:MAG TPA: YbgA family protein [Desulfobacterales bacterium]
MGRPIKIGVSACLMGENVRWNGGHSRSRFITDTLSQFVEFVPVCPEVEAGFPTPRETFRLVGEPDDPRLITTRGKVDHTDHMQQWARNRVRQLEEADLCGFIFKKDSPNSGLYRVKVYNDQGMPVKQGTGIFAREFVRQFPRVPVEEDGRLNDPKLRENFIEQIFAMRRWRDVIADRRTVGKLVDFHTRHKLLLLSHSPNHYRAMGKLVAAGKTMAIDELYRQYEIQFVEALRLRTTVKKNVNVLYHLMGYFKKDISADEKQEMIELIERYQQELVPLVVPVTLINHYVRKYSQPYLQEQVFLNPHPVELKLRNHA